MPRLVRLDLPFAQLRAFFYIVRFHGIMRAAKATGLAASTLSKQLSELEALVGQVLYQRDRFRPTRVGRELARSLELGLLQIKSSWDTVCANGHATHHFGAPEVISRLYLPGTVQKLEAQFPQLRCSTESATEENLERLLADDEVDFVIATEGPLWRKYRSKRLAVLPIGLICAAASPVRSVAPLWAQGAVRDRLYLSRSCDEALRSFDAGLAGLGVTWPDRRKVSSMMPVIEDAAAGRGFGLAVKVPPLIADHRIRFLPLPNFSPVRVSAFWKGGTTPVHQCAVELLHSLAVKMKIAA